MLAPSRSRLLASASSPVVATLPSFLVPALQTPPTPASRPRHFSSTPACPSKLGRTPITIPPGVEILIGEPMVKKDATSYLRIPTRTVTVSGPLGESAMALEW